MNSNNFLKLNHYSTVIAELNIVSVDQPWLNCEFIPNENFAKHSKFFNNFQNQYSNGAVQNFDTFFSQLQSEGYSLKSKNYELVRFIILWGESKLSVRLRGQRVKNT
ncbi:hypothetical protein C1E23_20915 [Pseudoalteromonas phenolica]|uniref:Uncharacterized protein n=1 Tax=Pseudoalteromonas phenolica TaxID=161398 RepID=A0A4Q7IGM8_9GAMM|nr:hypothetical protein [Pseudoalteromonas phenolica]RZQ51183.1 hypothetical protein C1E23_20915 [Pseudoalteromonas phenolica]